MDANHTSIILDIGDKSKLDPMKVMSLVVLEPKRYAFRPDQRLVRYLSKSESEALFETAALYLESLKDRCVTDPADSDSPPSFRTERG